MARPQKQRCICSIPQVTGFLPLGCEASGSVNLTYDEYEVIRLLDYMQMTQEQCAHRMGISRPTVTRIYKNKDLIRGFREVPITASDKRENKVR